MANTWKNRCKFASSTSGSSDFTVGAAQTGFRTPAQAGYTNTQTASYIAVSADLSEWEIGLGTYSTTGPTWQRTTVRQSSNSDTKVTFSTNPIVSISAVGEDFDALLSAGVVVDVQFFSASGTYTRAAGVTSALVIAQAAGGAGGGCSSSANQRGAGAGAGELRYGVVAPAATETITIGAVGTGSSNATGGTASDTTFGSRLTAKGGTGGAANGGAAGTTPTGSGGVALPNRLAADTGASNSGGAGALPWGGFVQVPRLAGSSGAAVGTAATAGDNGYGSGGGGAVAGSTGGAAKAGGNGAPGYMLVIGFK
jgi:hypothetical protein